MHPFRGSDAVAAGTMTVHRLRHDFTRIYRDVYVPRRTVITPTLRARAAWLFAGPDAVLTGWSAAALHGAKWVDVDAPAEVIRPGHRRPPPGMLVHNCALRPDEVCTIDGMRVVTAARAAFDLGRRLPRRDAIAALDDLCRMTGISVEDIAVVAKCHPHTPGMRDLLERLPFVDPGAESPPETHTRLAIVDAGLPWPETQIVHVKCGREFARSDMGWHKWRLLVEYDGSHHWLDGEQRSWDIERAEQIEELGWTIVKVDAQLLYRRPAALVHRVRKKLRDAGADV